MKQIPLVRLISFFLLLSHANAGASKIVIGLVIDQLPYEIFMRLLPSMTGGIRTIADHGTFYHNAIWPYAQPGTAQGHVGLVTGCLPSIHGVIANDWITPEGKQIAFGDADGKSAAVFCPGGTYSFGKSAALCLADTVCDQLMLEGGCNRMCAAYSFTLKPRSAIGMAGRLGKAIWFDHENGHFTSSKAYFTQLPAWLQSFNERTMSDLHTYQWKRFFPLDAQQYDCTRKSSLHKRKECPFDQKLSRSGMGPQKFYKEIAHTPAAHELTLSCAAECIKQLYDIEQDQALLFLIGLSAVDKTGHLYGPESCEYADMLFHLDAQIGTFMNQIEKIMPHQMIHYFLTSDHGCMQIPESLHEKGFDLARRLVTTDLVDDLNKHLFKQFKIKNAILQIDPPNIYFNHKVINALESTQHKALISATLKRLKTVPGIKNAWTYKELAQCACGPDDERFVFKNQSFNGRSGQIIFQVLPYTYISKYRTGTGHKSPYRYDTQVPLIFYQSAGGTSKARYHPVFLPQVAPTIAQILGICRPAACTFEDLIELCA